VNFHGRNLGVRSFHDPLRKGRDTGLQGPTRPKDEKGHSNAKKEVGQSHPPRGKKKIPDHH